MVDGQWTFWTMGEKLPRMLPLYEGGWSNRRRIGDIDRASVLAHCRWTKYPPTWENVKRGGKWIDIMFVGDYDAFMSDDYEEASETLQADAIERGPLGGEG